MLLFHKGNNTFRLRLVEYLARPCFQFLPPSRWMVVELFLLKYCVSVTNDPCHNVAMITIEAANGKGENEALPIVSTLSPPMLSKLMARKGHYSATLGHFWR